MKRLILIKHAAPRVEPGIPSDAWELSDAGNAQAKVLADRLREYGIASVVTSEEPKAAQTGRIVADTLGVSSTTAVNLHEHDRSNVPHMGTGEFISHVEVFFRRPSERVLGRESADEALQRFASALRHAIEASPADQTLAIVAHGTVIALLVASHNPQQNGFLLWRQMKLPSFVVLDASTFQIERIVKEV